MKYITCPTCEGNGKFPCRAQVLTEKGWGYDPPMDKPPLMLDCHLCDGKGLISQERHQAMLEQSKIWCNCEESSGVSYHEDDNSQIYGNGVTCSKHHYSCNDCGLIVQIG